MTIVLLLSFTEWLALQGEDPNFEQLSATDISHHLGNFYRYYQANDSLPNKLLQFYPQEVTRYLQAQPFCRDVDIAYGQEFAASIRVLEAIVQESQDTLYTMAGGEMETATRPILPAHIQILYASHLLGCNDPFSLQNKVWMDVNLYFGVLSRILLRQLKKTSFVLEMDPVIGRRFYMISDPRISKDKVRTRMYEQPGSRLCPVTSLLLYLSKLNPNSDVFFQQPRREGLPHRWYTETAVGKNVHSNKLATLCSQAGIKTYYRNTALRMFSRTILTYASDHTYAFSDEIARTIHGDNTV